MRNLADRARASDRVPRGVHVLRAPPRPARHVDRHDVPARDGPGRRPARTTAFIDQASLGMRLVALLTIPAAVGTVRPAPTDHRAAAPARPVRRRRRRQHVARTGRVRARARRRSRSTCSSCAGSTPTRTPARRSSSTSVENVLNIVLAVVLVGRYGVLGLGPAFALAYVVVRAVGAAGAGYKVPGFALRAGARGLGRDVARRGDHRRGGVVVAGRVGGDAGAEARCAARRRHGRRRRRRTSGAASALAGARAGLRCAPGAAGCRRGSPRRLGACSSSSRSGGST